jgi:hypothetical protein
MFALLCHNQNLFEIVFALPFRYNRYHVSIPDPLLAEIAKGLVARG